MSRPPAGEIGRPAAPSSEVGGGLPREGSRETHEGIIISEAWDWCKSDTAPVPYPLTAKQIQACNLANTVRQTDDASHVRGSIVDTCEGDEGGTGGGIFSGTHNGACWPKTWSETVRFEGRNAVRHDDEWWMNNGNTWGRLQYVKNRTRFAPVQVATIDPLMGLGSGVGSETPASGSRGTDDLNAYEALSPAPSKSFDRQALKPFPIPNAEDGGSKKNNIVRISGGCNREIGTYGTLKCTQFDATGKRYRSHHFIPDWTMGLSLRCGRKSGTQRIANMPSYNDMPAICLQGDTSDPADDCDSQKSEHGMLQATIDYDIMNASHNHMIKLKDVIYWSLKDTGEKVNKVGHNCDEDLKTAVDTAFAGVKDRDQLVRGDSRDPSSKALKPDMDYLMQKDGVFSPPPDS